MAFDSKTVRRAQGAGRWYPAAPAKLDAMVRQCLDDADVGATDGLLLGVMAPHAGYIYSGPVCGYAFGAVAEDARLRGAPDVVAVLGFCHATTFPGVALMDGSELVTPLGGARLDAEAADVLCDASTVVFSEYEPHAGEHSAENQVPFVQSVLPDTPLVLALMGDHTELTVDGLVQALTKLGQDRRVLIVSSTDLLHDPDYDRVTRTDRDTLACIARLDLAGLALAWSYRNQVCCGIGPVRVLMRIALARGCRAGAVLSYRNSGDDFPEGRGNWVVGYGAVAFAAPPA